MSSPVRFHRIRDEFEKTEELKASIAKLQEKLDHSTRMESSILEAVELARKPRSL